MAVITPQEYVLDPAGVGDTERFNLAKTEFAAQIVSKFQDRFDAWEMVEKEGANGAKTKTETAFGEMEALNHTPGEFLDGQNVAKEARSISLEDLENIASVSLPWIEDLINHLNSKPEYASMAAIALRKRFNKDVLQQVVLAARMAARTVGSQTFDSGNRTIINVSGATVLADVFPNSTAGAGLLLEAMGDLKMQYDDHNVDENIDRVLFLNPYLHEVLQQDKSLLSRDYDGQQYNSLIKGKVMYAKGFMIAKTPSALMPTDDLSGAATAGDKRVSWINGAAAYRGDFRQVAAICMVPGAIKARVGENILPIVERHGPTRSTWIGAAAMKGLGIHRPELAGVIEWSGT